MKSAMEELFNTQKEFAISSLGVSETISYIHQSGLTSDGVGAFVDAPKFSDEIKGQKRIDTVTFSNVLLSEEPTIRDTIEYNNEEYRVKEWIFSIGLYIIQAYKNKRSSVSYRK